MEQANVNTGFVPALVSHVQEEFDTFPEASNMMISTVDES